MSVSLVSAALAGILFLAAAMKLADPSGLETFLLALGFSGSTTWWLPRAVAVAEAAVGTGLITFPKSTVVDLAAIALTGSFLAAIIAAHIRAVDVDCGCFGALDTRSSGHSTVRAVLLFATAAGVLIGSLTIRFDSDPGIRFTGLATGVLVLLATLTVPRLHLLTNVYRRERQ